MERYEWSIFVPSIKDLTNLMRFVVRCAYQGKPTILMDSLPSAVYGIPTYT